ncbi:RagB/SusD family nutrient uptake outer membrane protein [Rhodoflexus caldus]|uniref:RagB/SusD family nutrient uptake outer membrane protein n=1 Tax=Rhodoflexus caldus TaxID=2891236 RepID=UPI00202AA662|nr:RagB/SusD family nutrient uptake outer membrane protein [Rhodoflexus caldus]
MLKKTIYAGLLAVALLGNSGCSFFKLENAIDPNNPSLQSVSQNATRNQIQSLISGLEFRHRAHVFTVTAAFGCFGREIWYLNASDPRWQTDWLGQGGRRPDGQFFGVGPAYDAPYQTIKQGNVLLQAIRNTNVLTEQERLAVSGFTKTIQAYQYMIVANGQFQNGIRIDVADELNPGPFVPYNEALTRINALLNEANDELSRAGTGNFPFRLTAGFTANNFGTIASIRQLNRAIAARLAVYRQDWQGALTALGQSFMNIDGDLEAGPAFVYGAPPDIFNPLFFVLNAPVNTMIVVHPSLISDALPGDLRVQRKFFRRSSPVVVTTDNIPLSGEWQDLRYPTNTTPVKYLRNEELVLIYAEANAQAGNSGEAVRAINRIRTAAGLPAYTGATTRDALINEILFQRRYSLWCEPWGHRWVDARRYNRLNEIPVALDRGAVFTQLERPIAEVNWELLQGR